KHIHDVIKMRTHYDRKRARRFPHESIDALTPDGAAATMAEVEAALLERAPDAPNVLDYAPSDPVLVAERVAKLRQLAAGDRAVVRLLDALASGAISKTDVMRAAALSNVEYDNARRRLRRLVMQLSKRPGGTGSRPRFRRRSRNGEPTE